MSNLNDDIEIYSDDCYNEDSDKEYFDDLIILMKKILMKKFEPENLMYTFIFRKK